MTVSDSSQRVKEADAARSGDVVALPYQLLFLLSDESPSWFRDFYATLATALPTTVRATDQPAKFQHLIDTQKPDALLACADPAPLACFQALMDEDRPGRPLCALIVRETQEQDFTADLILPPSLHALRYQLRTGLRLRADALALAERNRALTAELDRKQQALIAGQRAIDEVTLLKETIIANVTHELRTPILHLKGAVSLLAEESAQQSKLIDYAKQATARVESIVQNISQLASSLDINIQPLIVRDVLEQAERSLRRSWQHRDSADRVVFEVERQLPPVMGDRQALVTVMQHLMENALKFSKDDVAVTAKREGDQVALSVRDTGIGMTTEETTRIFDMFYQVDSGTNRRYSGTGTGLAIVRLVLEKHDVSIQVASEPGAGSTFTFHLPVADLQRDLHAL